MSAPPSANPYAPPQTPTGPLQLDFREAAVEQSLQIMAANPGRAPEELGISLVLPAGDDRGPDRLRWIARMTLVRLVLGVVGLAVGALIGTAVDGILREQGIPKDPAMVVAALCSLGGMALLLLNAWLIRRSVQRALGPRYEACRRHSTLRRPLCTGVEDARTFTSIKLAPEDFACVAFDSAGRRLILEGLLFRYVIHAADVLSVVQQSGTATTGVQIEFRVGAVAVGITLQFDGVINELRKWVSFGKDPLLAPVVAALSGGKA
jgi:hypothetical protein